MKSFKQIASTVRGEDVLEEGLKPEHKMRPGWMLKADPKLGKAVKDKIGLAKKRQATYGDKSAGKSIKEESIEEAGLWDNIHAKRERIKKGSGERMRKPGSEGAPSEKDLKNSQTNEEVVAEADKHSMLGKIQRHQELKNKVDTSFADIGKAQKAGDHSTASKAFRKHERYANLERPGTWTKSKEQGVAEGYEPGDKITWYHSNHHPEIEGTVIGRKDGHLIVKSIDPTPRNTEKTVAKYRVPKNNILSHNKQGVSEEKKDKYDEGEYDREGDMAKSDLRSIIANAQKMHDMIDDADNLPEWVQSKITIAEDYISTVANYMTAEMNEETKDFSKYIIKPTKTEPKIVRKTNPAGRTTDHVEYEVHGTLSSHKKTFKSKKEAEEYFKIVKEDVEQLDEMPGANMDTRAVHQHLKKKGWSLTRTSGGHDVFTHPEAKHHIPVPRHRQLKAPLVKGILKQSEVREEFVAENKDYDDRMKKALDRAKNATPRKPTDEYERKVVQHLKKKHGVKEEVGQMSNSNENPNAGRFTSGPAKKPAKPTPIVTSEQTVMSKVKHLAKTAARKQAGLKEEQEPEDSFEKTSTPAKRSLSKTAGIVKDLAKNSKSSKKEKDDAFQAEPELSSQIIKT